MDIRQSNNEQQGSDSLQIGYYSHTGNDDNQIMNQQMALVNQSSGYDFNYVNENYNQYNNFGKNTFEMSSITNEINDIQFNGLSNFDKKDDNKLPDDIISLQKLLELRIKYTRPQQGGYWNFQIVNDVSYLKNCIKFIDDNCMKNSNALSNFGPNTEHHLAGSANYNDSSSSRGYLDYLEILEMTIEEIDAEFNVKFYPYLSFKFVKNEMINLMKNSRFEYLSKLISLKRPLGNKITKSWVIYPNNKIVRMNDYIKFYDLMDVRLQEWIYEKCLIDSQTKDLCVKENFSTVYEMLEMIEKSQNVSEQIILLINKINGDRDGASDSSGDEYLSDGYLPYLTYIDHLQTAIESSFPNCENAYKTSTLLMLATRGMKQRYPQLYSVFKIKLSEFLDKNPNFTLGDLSDFINEIYTRKSI